MLDYTHVFHVTRECAMSLNFGLADNTMTANNCCKYHPFKEESQVLSFCDVNEIKSVRKKIASSLESGGSLHVVYGEKGIGKTMLARNISLSRRLNAQIIKGANGLTVINLIKRLCSAINSPMASLSEPPMKHINTFADNFAKQEKPLCIMIDDAQLLPLQTLAALINCNNKILQDGRYDFTIALFGTPDLKDKISPLTSDDDKLETVITELSRLSDESTIHYIYTKLRHAGWKGPLPMISGNEMKTISSKSGGIPSNINHVIGYHYYDTWLGNWQNGQNRTVKSIPDAQQITVLVVGLALIAGVMSWSNQNHNLIEYYVSASNTLVDKTLSLFG